MYFLYVYIVICKYKPSVNKTLLDKEISAKKLSVIGNPLKIISKIIDIGIFRHIQEEVLLHTEKKSNVGTKFYDVVVMFKILV